MVVACVSCALGAFPSVRRDGVVEVDPRQLRHLRLRLLYDGRRGTAVLLLLQKIASEVLGIDTVCTVNKYQCYERCALSKYFSYVFSFLSFFPVLGG